MKFYVIFITGSFSLDSLCFDILCFQACRENHVDVVALLLDNGCSVNANFPNSRENPLTLAAEKGWSSQTLTSPLITLTYCTFLLLQLNLSTLPVVFTVALKESVLSQGMWS